MADISQERASELFGQVQSFYFEDESFCKSIEDFAFEKCDIIDSDSDENKFEYTELYREFTELFESRMASFLSSVGSSLEEFYEACKKVVSDDNSWESSFVSVITMTTDFESFMNMMRDAKRDKLR